MTSATTHHRASLKAKVGIIHIPDEFEFEKLISTLTQSAKDTQLYGLIIIIDNDGGNIGQFSGIHDLIKKITLKKPVVGLVIGNACSSGYLIASATTFLICAEASDIGSIGSIMEIEKYTDQRLASNDKNNIEAKIDYEIFSKATYKTIHSSNAPLTQIQREYLKKRNERTYEYLIGRVAANRNLLIENHLEWADAKTFLGVEAVELGLVDSLGTIIDAEEKILELIKQKNSDVTFDNNIQTTELN